MTEIRPSHPQFSAFPSQHTRQSFAEGSDDCDGGGDGGEYDMMVNIIVIVMVIVTVVVVMVVVIEMMVVVVMMTVTVVMMTVTVMVIMMAVDAGFGGKILHNR